MNGSRRPRVAAEGIPFVAGTAVVAAAAWFVGGPIAALPLFALFVWTLLVFHDPLPELPAAPLGVLSPVDGRVEQVDVVEDGLPDGPARRIVIRARVVGTYTARAPVEGKVMDLQGDERQHGSDNAGLWLRTDEGLDVVLRFTGHRFGLTPRALVRYGQRLGPGQPCAYLRLARYAEVRIPVDSKVTVSAGQRVAAGTDLLGKLASQLPQQ